MERFFSGLFAGCHQMRREISSALEKAIYRRRHTFIIIHFTFAFLIYQCEEENKIERFWLL